MNTDRPHGHPHDDVNVSSPNRAAVQLDGPGQLLTVLPYLLGFHPPVGSLTVVAFRRQRVALIARVDLPTPERFEQPDTVPTLWAQLGRHLTSVGAETLSLVGHTDSHREEDLYELHAAAPLPVQDLVRTMSGRWWNLHCPSPATCRQDACHPWGDRVVDDPRLAAVLVAHGAAVPGTRADLDRILLPGPPDLVDAVTARLPLIAFTPRGAAFAALAAAHTARADGPAAPDADTAALLLQALTDGWVRDACLAWADDAAWWLWTDLIRAAPRGWIAPVATLIAIVAYRRGDGVTATIAAEHALLDRPDYTLAHLVLDSLKAAVTPDQLAQVITSALADLPDELRTTPGT